MKYDNFRALAHVQARTAELVSRNGNRFVKFAGLAAELRACLRVGSAVLDGEVVCLDGDGRPQFNDLLFWRDTPTFVAFEVLALNGRDVRPLPLLRRKRYCGACCRPEGAACYTRITLAARRELFDAVCA